MSAAVLGRSSSIHIPANKVVGVVDASASGKSTAIDILLGLIEPDSGQLMVDGRSVDSSNRRAWQNNLGYVSQAIFLADSSIRENIAFGLPTSRINDERVTQAAKLARLDELVDGLPEGLNTRVGERGIQISGGQRQRIGISRALYSDGDMPVFDEPTSALDGITDSLVMDAIHDFTGKNYCSNRAPAGNN
jgi:ATP-binding cassette, subfamily B, bacterial PglK